MNLSYNYPNVLQFAFSSEKNKAINYITLNPSIIQNAARHMLSKYSLEIQKNVQKNTKSRK